MVAQYYRTARFAPESVAALPHLVGIGEVKVDWFARVYDGFTRQKENVYSVYDGAHFLGHFFEKSLTAFCM